MSHHSRSSVTSFGLESTTTIPTPSARGAPQTAAFGRVARAPSARPSPPIAFHVNAKGKAVMDGERPAPAAATSSRATVEYRDCYGGIEKTSSATKRLQEQLERAEAKQSSYKTTLSQVGQLVGPLTYEVERSRLLTEAVVSGVQSASFAAENGYPFVPRAALASPVAILAALVDELRRQNDEIRESLRTQPYYSADDIQSEISSVADFELSLDPVDIFDG